MGLLAGTLVLLVGTVGFTLLEGLRVVDSFYLAGITLCTVGYGDVHAKTDLGRIFGAFLSLTGLGVFSALVQQSGRWHANLHRNSVIEVCMLLAIILGTGTILFVLVEGVDAKTALFLSFDTATTIGYGVTPPVTDLGKVVAVLYALSAIAPMAFVTGWVANVMLRFEPVLKSQLGAVRHKLN